MLNQVVHVTPLPNYALEIEFRDGVYGIIDLSDRLFGEMFEPLRDDVRMAAERLAHVHDWIAHEAETSERAPQSRRRVGN